MLATVSCFTVALPRRSMDKPSVTRACAAATSIKLEETDRAVIESISIGFPSTYRFVYIWVSDTFAYSAPQQ